MNKALAELNALCLANAQDIIERLYSDTDKDIEDRYETEENGLNEAIKYIELAERASKLATLFPLPDMMRISQPKEDGSRVWKTYVFSEREKQ